MKYEILYSKPGVKIVTSPFLVGDELAELSLQASMDFLKQVNPENPTEVIILQGGKYYRIGDAYEKLHGSRPPVCEIHSKRFLKDDEWHARVWGLQAEQLDGRSPVVGDTIATGTTLQYVLDKILDDCIENDAKIKDIYIFSIAGAGKGEEKLEKINERLKEFGAELKIYYANARFGLADNGTDLLFDSAEYHPQAKEEIKEILGDFTANMKCAIWDWGDRFTNPPHHLKEAYEYYQSVNSPDWILEGFKERIE